MYSNSDNNINNNNNNNNNGNNNIFKRPPKQTNTQHFQYPHQGGIKQNLNQKRKVPEPIENNFRDDKNNNNIIYDNFQNDIRYNDLNKNHSPTKRNEVYKDILKFTEFLSNVEQLNSDLKESKDTLNSIQLDLSILETRLKGLIGLNSIVMLQKQQQQQQQQ
ncbi:hypothetical protein DICPUDRAFT_90994 [Dictyostelium purpureum]|uniref:Uncharacterized protein n=1 Tax=Dictyostelium purpureum TaxID=5786 RepID=F1A6A3_DICPU|nr:uncharacterized protein DICPUDRAFT_90994 [Dictyostelium purpureum]EGC28277.1 hypothetical protein DICPUDRAFT_90994 [Dictyostelium purpureum]|eukprot:XP_003295197.1 hypothetical protein DICPUDRAFT_90994 [Dictyostelium purpureum]